MVFRVMINKVMVNKVEDEERAGLLQHSAHHQRYDGVAEEEIVKRDGSLEKVPHWAGWRRVHVAILVFFGLITNFMLRVNIMYAIEYMYIGGTAGKETIKSAFFIGYVIMQVPGGRLAEVFGTKRVFGFCTILCGLLAALTPFVGQSLHPSLSFPTMCALRFLQGLLQSPCFPSLNPLTNRWVPESEKGKFVTFAFNGGTVGAVITFPLCGIIIENSSWVWVFYVSAILTLAWGSLWFLFMYDLPESDPYISVAEKKLILSERSYNPSQMVADQEVPLLPLVLDMLKTPAVWINMVGDFANNFGSYVLLSEAPAFFKGLLPLGKDAELLGYICATPHLAHAVYSLLAGIISDKVVASSVLDRLAVQKVNTALAFLVPAFGLIILPSLATPENQVWFVFLLVASWAFNGSANAGHVQNIIGLAPNRSGTLYGFTNGFGNISGYIVPQLKNYIVQDERNVLQWRWLFFLTAGINFTFATLFTVFASSTVQTFNHKTYKSTKSYFTTGDFLKFPVSDESSPPQSQPSYSSPPSSSSSSSSSTTCSSSPVSLSCSVVSNILSSAHPV